LNFILSSYSSKAFLIFKLADKLIAEMDLNLINFSCQFCDWNFYSEIGFVFHSKSHSKQFSVEEKTLKDGSTTSPSEKNIFETIQKELTDISVNVEMQPEEFASSNFRLQNIIPLQTDLLNFSSKERTRESREETLDVISSNENVTESKETEVKTTNDDENIDLKKVHKNFVTPDPSKLSTFNCASRTKCFTEQFDLKTHIADVHDKLKPFECPNCEKCFARKYNLEHHVASVHDKIRPFKCHICEKCFATKSHLKSHISFVHDNLNPLKCQSCEKCFLTRYCLEIHIANFNCKLRPVNCQIGQNCFENKNVLKKQIAADHDKVKPFQLSIM
jgi:hypothetical protein